MKQALLKARIIGQQGQSLAEFVLVLPIMLLLFFGTVQLGMLSIASFFTHYAARCAARSYTVYAHDGGAVALEKAQEAASQALRLLRPLGQALVSVQDGYNSDGLSTDSSKFKGPGALFYRIKVEVRYPLLFHVPFLGRTANLQSHTLTYSENTREANTKE